jgi:1,4-dihydroxy-2-naphthoyl-CoA hydrolase
MDLAASIQDRLRGLFPDLLGIELTEVAPERVAARLTVRDELCTTGKVLHGGAIMAFADTLGAVGTFVNLPQGARTTTIESKTNFLGAAPLGARILGESTPIHRGRTTMVWQTRITLETGKLVALVMQTQMVLPG